MVSVKAFRSALRRLRKAVWSQQYLKETSDHMDIGPGCSHEHAYCQAGVDVLQVHLGRVGAGNTEGENNTVDIII
jgi:hypothetical protein